MSFCFARCAKRLDGDLSERGEMRLAHNCSFEMSALAADQTFRVSSPFSLPSP
jgi:hypothetical protein